MLSLVSLLGLFRLFCFALFYFLALIGFRETLNNFFVKTNTIFEVKLEFFSILSQFEENLIGKQRLPMRILEVEHDFFKTHVPAVILKTFCQRPNFARILNP